MTLNAINPERVAQIFEECQFNKENRDKKDMLKTVPGIKQHRNLHLGRLTEHQEEIKAMLRLLPEAFAKNKGGMSIIEARRDKNGRMWTEGKPGMTEQLMQIGAGIGMVEFANEGTTNGLPVCTVNL